MKIGKDTNSYKLAKHAIETNLYEMSNKSAFGSKIISKTIITYFYFKTTIKAKQQLIINYKFIVGSESKYEGHKR